MTAFDVIHNVITDHSLSVGRTTVVSATPTELASAIVKALCPHENRSVDVNNRPVCADCGVYP